LYEASAATEKHLETPGSGIHGVAMMEDGEEGGAALRAKLLTFIADAFRKAGVSDSPATQPEMSASPARPSPSAPIRNVALDGQSSGGDQRRWMTVALPAGVAVVLVIGAVVLLRHRHRRG